jgi:hypothetical protein
MWGWVGAAAAAEAVAYTTIGLHLRRLALASGDLPRRVAVELALVIAGFGLLTPASPVEGLAISGRELRRRGFSPRQATLTVGFGQWFALRAFLLVAGIDVLVAAALGDLVAVDVVSFVSAASILIVALALTARLAGRPGSAARIAVLLGSLKFWRPRSPPNNVAQPAPSGITRRCGSSAHLPTEECSYSWQSSPSSPIWPPSGHLSRPWEFTFERT